MFHRTFKQVRELKANILKNVEDDGLRMYIEQFEEPQQEITC